MVGVASTTIKAALVEDSIGSTTNLEHAQDPNVQVNIVPRPLEYHYNIITIEANRICSRTSGGY